MPRAPLLGELARVSATERFDPFQTAFKTAQCIMESNPLCGQLGAVHHKVAGEISRLDLHLHAQRFGKLPGRCDHVGIVPAAKIVYTAGQLQGGEELFHHFPHPADTPVVVR